MEIGNPGGNPANERVPAFAGANRQKLASAEQWGRLKIARVGCGDLANRILRTTPHQSSPAISGNRDRHAGFGWRRR